MSLNEITLRRRNRIFIPAGESGRGPSKGTVAAFNLNLQGLGYTLHPSAIKDLLAVKTAVATKIMTDTLAALKKVRGVTRYAPMYPNFPAQVAEADEAELYLNAALHYFSFMISDLLEDPDIVWLPKYVKNKREPLDEKVELTVLRTAIAADLQGIATGIATSNTNISETDKADLRELVPLGYLEPVTGDQIPNRENKAVVAAILWENRKEFGEELVTTVIVSYVDTATDVLRFATALSGGDVSLAEVTKFRSFKRGERRLLLGLLNMLPSGELPQDMLRWKQRWLRLGERLHPREFDSSRKYRKAVAAFSMLRNDLPITTFNSKAESLVKQGLYVELAEYLRQRPGELARRLDQILRMATRDRGAGERNSREIVNTFAKVSALVSTPVLLQVLTHFKVRNTQNMRVVFPKGSLCKVQAIEGHLPPISPDICGRIVVACEHALKERFAELPKLGKVYLDPMLENYLLPFSQRSASKSLRTLVRGSRIPFSDEKDTIRFFIHWKNIGKGYDGGRVDLDLSAIMYDAEWKNMGQIWYGNLREAGYRAYHSGDITNAPKGACEFIDIDIPSLIAHGGRYVAMDVRSFTGDSFKDVPECFAGWMLREKPQSGEIFDPKTVADRLDLTADGTSGMPLIIDLVDRVVIWCDAAMKSRRHAFWGNNVKTNSDTAALIGQAFTKIAKPDLYTLLYLHATARGRLVKTPKNADTVFSVEAGTPFDIAMIASEYMKNAATKPFRRKTEYKLAGV